MLLLDLLISHTVNQVMGVRGILSRMQDFIPGMSTSVRSLYRINRGSWYLFSSLFCSYMSRATNNLNIPTYDPSGFFLVLSDNASVCDFVCARVFFCVFLPF